MSSAWTRLRARSFLLVLALGAGSSISSVAQDVDPGGREIGGQRMPRYPQSMKPQPPPPPPPSVPAVTRAEADAVLVALADAYRREDAKAVGRLHAEESAFAFKAERDAQKVFAERNRSVLTFDVASERALDDGGLELVALVRLEYVPAGQRHARMEKRRWTFRFARRPGRDVVLAGQLPSEGGLLPQFPPWRNAVIGGVIRLPGSSATLEGRLALELELHLSNVSDTEADVVAFALHPFSVGLRALQGETELETSRIEASLDAWHVTLKEPVPPGAETRLLLRYELEQPGEVAASSIAPDFVRLYTASAWLPAVEPLRAGSLPEREHDLVVIGPADLVFSMPGRRTDLPSPADGLISSRFVSELPAVETPLVAARGSLETRRLGPALVLEIMRTEGGGDPARAASHATTLTAFMEDRLGPAPVSRLALAESLDGGFREAPGWIALPTLEIPKHDADREESDQVFLFMGISMARLWLLHAFAPTGLGGRDVAQGLGEHLVGEWSGAAVRRDAPQKQRSAILAAAQVAPQLDQPLLPVGAGPQAPPIYRHGKARMVFDSYRLLVGGEAWHRILASWARETVRGGPITTLIDRMAAEPGAEAFVEAFFRRQGACQVSIADMRLLPLPAEDAARLGLDPAAWNRIEIEIDNAGLGPVPVELQIQMDQGLRHERLVVPEYGRAVLTLVGAALPTRIRLDPAQILWQSRSDDDVYPDSRRKKRDIFDAAARHGQPRRGGQDSGAGGDPRR